MHDSPTVTLAFAVAALAIPFLIALAWPWRRRRADASKAYIIHNKVTHTRLLPATASHAFTYPTLFIQVSLRLLEAHTFDLGGGWLFGYGGISWRMLGLRASAYLHAWEPELSILEKLRRVDAELSRV